MHTVELLPDAALAEAVRKQWDLVKAAGLPSLANHSHPTNRPHVTLATAASLDGLPPLPLPLPVVLEAPRMLGRALVRPVVMTEELRALQARVWSALDSAWPPPAEFVPHFSLALRIAALPALSALAEPLSGALVAARSYDTTTRSVRDL